MKQMKVFLYKKIVRSAVNNKIVSFKVKRAKARDLKARKALVQALKKQRDKKVAKKKRSRDDWDHMKKSAEDEFELSLQNMKLEIRNSSPK